MTLNDLERQFTAVVGVMRIVTKFIGILFEFKHNFGLTCRLSRVTRAYYIHLYFTNNGSIIQKKRT